MPLNTRNSYSVKTLKDTLHRSASPKSFILSIVSLLPVVLLSCSTTPRESEQDGWKGQVKESLEFRQTAQGPLRITKTVYDDQGLRLSRAWYIQNLNILNQEEAYFRDSHSRITQAIVMAGGLPVEYIQTTYNASGQPSTVIRLNTQGQVLSRQETLYDQHSQVTQTQIAGPATPLLVKNWHYRQVGRVDILEIHVDGMLSVYWRYFYDSRGRLIHRISDLERVSLYYDTQSRLTQETHLLKNIPFSKKTYQYDKMGNRLYTREWDYNNQVWQLLSWSSNSFAYYP